MAEQKGKLITCDRCGATCFLKTIGDGVLDGFEERPKNWKYYSDDRIGHLCPKCDAEYEKLIKIFMEECNHG